MTDPDQIGLRVQKSIDDRSGEILGFLSKYLQQRSVNPRYEEGAEEKTCQEWLREELASWRTFDEVDYWEMATDRPNVVAVMKGRQGAGGTRGGKSQTGRGGRSLIFNGHSDVVPVPKESLPFWTMNPWGGEVKEGKVYGRGATDMKGGIAAFLWAARIIKDMGISLQGDVVDTMTIAEESGEHRISVDSVVERGYGGDFLVNAEATNLKLCPVGVGVYFFKLKIRGKPIHTSQKYKCSFPQPLGVAVPGVSAIDKMAKFIIAFQDLERQWAHRKKYGLVPLGASNLTPTLIKGGEYIGGISENCEVIYNVWINPDETHEESIREVKEFVSRIAGNDEWLRDNPPVVEAPPPEFTEFWPSYSIPLDHPGCQAAADAYSAVFGRENEAQGGAKKWGAFTAVADLAWMNRAGIPGLIFGPGELSMGVHGIDEYVPVQQVIDCTKFYAEMMLRWCGVERA